MDQLVLSEKAVQTLQSNLGTLLASQRWDQTSPLLPRVAEHLKEGERLRVTAEWFTYCGLDQVVGPLATLEVDKRSQVGSMNKGPGFAIAPVDFTGKVVGRSLMQKFDLYKAPRSGFHVDTTLWKSAMDKVTGLYDWRRFGKLKPLPLAEAALSFPGKSGYGYPFMSSSKEECNEQCFYLSAKIRDSGYDRKWIELLPAVGGTRSVNRGPYLPANRRAIAQVARVINNLNKQIQGVVQGVLRDRQPRIFCAWINKRAVKRAMTQLLDEKPRKLLCADYEGFDASVPNEVIDAVYEILSRWFVTDAAPLIRFNRDAFKRMGILLPGYRVKPEERTGGVPSGSVDTNLVDTIANLLVMEYTGLLLKTPVLMMYPQGDDCVVRFQGNPTLEDICGVVSSSFGMSISLKKTSYELKQAHFLQDLYLDEIRDSDGLVKGMRPIMHVLPHMLGYEKMDDDDWERLYDSVRWVQQMSECEDHPSFTLGCDLLAHSDPLTARVVEECRNNNDTWLRKAVAAIARKRSSLGWGISLDTFKSSAAVRYLASR